MFILIKLQFYFSISLFIFQYLNVLLAFLQLRYQIIALNVLGISIAQVLYVSSDHFDQAADS